MVIYVAIRQMYVDVLYLNVTQTINNNMIIKTKRKTSAMVDYKLASQLQNNIRNRRGKKRYLHQPSNDNSLHRCRCYRTGE